MSSKGKSGPTFVPELDGIRGVAITQVVLFHGVGLFSLHWIDSLLARVVTRGFIGVDLFFVLSGYLITKILWSDVEQGVSIKYFYIRRSLRILPLFYLVLLLGWLGPRLPGWPLNPLPSSELVWGATFLSNFRMAYLGDYFLWLGVTWSLALEEQFYLVWPWVLHRCKRETIWRICLAILPIALLCRISLVLWGASDVALRVLPFTRFDALACDTFP